MSDAQARLHPVTNADSLNRTVRVPYDQPTLSASASTPDTETESLVRYAQNAVKRSEEYIWELLGDRKPRITGRKQMKSVKWICTTLHRVVLDCPPFAMRHTARWLVNVPILIELPNLFRHLPKRLSRERCIQTDLLQLLTPFPACLLFMGLGRIDQRLRRVVTELIHECVEMKPHELALATPERLVSVI